MFNDAVTVSACAKIQHTHSLRKFIPTTTSQSTTMQASNVQSSGNV